VILRFDLGDRSDFIAFPRLLHSIERGDPALLQWFVQKRWTQFSSVNAMYFVMDGASGAPPGRWEQIEAEAATSLLGNAMNFPFPEINEVFGTPDLGDAFRAPIVSSVRTLLLSGTLDWNTPPHQAELARFGLINSTHIVVEGAGHEQIIPQPEVRAAILAFLRGEDVGEVRVRLPPLRFIPIDGVDPAITHPSLGP
jgi:pimeloyl-ACP methyl ester carboxylesterase